MYTVMDYLKYYRDIPFTEVSLNQLDFLICAILVYLPLNDFKEAKSLKDFSKIALELENKDYDGMMIPKSYEVLKYLQNAKRYADMKIMNFVNLKNEKTQFGACKFLMDKKTIIAFKGTDGSTIGWVENFRLLYDYPTYTQRLSLNYLEDNIKFNDKNVYVVGHSKGGNLAMASVMELSRPLFKKVKKVYNFDGPGFLKKEFDSLKYRELLPKLVNIIPTGSVVGSLLFNKNYTVVESCELAFNEHYPTTWGVFGEFFLEGTLSSVSKHLNESTTIGMDNLENEKVKEAVEMILKNIEKKYDEEFEFNINDVKNLLKNRDNIDPEVAKYLTTMLPKMFFAVTGKNMND
ncbi:DUF2974 domain-containing protein [bacterium]|uniref:Mbeg1-like protein n=1 Tax=Candidatus Ventrenecus sp. TaxID=3085654 RepID=UPI001DFC751A|nr:DUF2974 domain-containing protein [bacterium]